MKTTLVLALSTLLSFSATAGVIKKKDQENNCILFKVAPADQQGKIKLAKGEEIVFVKDTYGLSFVDMEINFDAREVHIQPIANIVLGINRPLTLEKVAIAESHPDFTFLINQLNRKVVNLFEEMCISSDNKLIYTKVFEPAPEESSKLK